MLALLRHFSWGELRHHPWRNLAAVAAIMLGVALALATHLINHSALAEFSNAVRAVSGKPDVELRGPAGQLDACVLGHLSADEQVAVVSPVIELYSQLRTPKPVKADSTPTAPTDLAGPLASDEGRLRIKVLGLDAGSAARLSPNLLPTVWEPNRRAAWFEPDGVFLNNAALLAAGLSVQPGQTIELQSGLSWRRWQVLGAVAAPGAPLVVMDVAAAQSAFGLGTPADAQPGSAACGALTRIDIRLRPGVDAQAWGTGVAQLLKRGITAGSPQDSSDRLGEMSRAYRANLSVLALVALFTGAYLVFSVVSLSVAKRTPQLALLGVLGLAARQRMALVMVEAAALGVVGSIFGVALGSALAFGAMRWLGGDLGGGYFASVSPSLHFDLRAAVLVALLGVAAAVVGAAAPARDAARIAPAQALKGLGVSPSGNLRNWQSWWPFGLLICALAGSFAPPIAGLPLAAYAAIAFLIVGGIGALPALTRLALGQVRGVMGRHILGMLAVERAYRVQHTATVAVSGVVAALSLAVALTVMVASFRASVLQWLDAVLPAALYVRTAAASGNDAVFLSPEVVRITSQTDGVASVKAQRVRNLQLKTALPAVALTVTEFEHAAASTALPLIQGPLPVPPGRVGIYVSEAMLDLYDAQPGQNLLLGGLNAPDQAVLTAASAAPGEYFVAGVWRDYARQHGSVAIRRTDYVALTGDTRINDLAIYLNSGASETAVMARIKDRVANAAPQAVGLLEFASAVQIRRLSLTIFDRSFAVTYWLQAVAIGIGLFGVAASFSAQVLARRKEFGLLAHLGLTRAQVLRLVAAEGAVWTGIGSAAGVALGLAVSLVLVHVVNPQSFHWTMDLHVPWWRLGALGLAVMACGTVTAWLCARAATGADVIAAVKEDW